MTNNISLVSLSKHLESFDAIICFSHLRWDFVFQRPQHLMTRFSKAIPVYFFEEPVVSDGAHLPHLEIRREDAVTIATPQLPPGLSESDTVDAQRVLLDSLLAQHSINRALLWYYTPLSLTFSDHLAPAATVYDCMDELTGFLGAPCERLRSSEKQLMARTKVVFAGGHSLFKAKKKLHENTHAFPSSVDTKHFGAARQKLTEPADQAEIPHPRLGFYGVIDERMDVDLIAKLAALRPDWHIVLVGPVVKISLETLPKAANIHYLGSKTYGELPAYISSWDVAIMPFAINDATRFISPTKTPEYLAAGRPVVSTPIVDVVNDYGRKDLVAIAADAAGFAKEINQIIDSKESNDWLSRVDSTLAKLSWDTTCERMMKCVADTLDEEATAPVLAPASKLFNLAAKPFDYLIVGAGFAGAVLAERLAAGSGKRVLLVDRRPHIGGNAYDYYNDAGILVHRYGPHIFHTNAERIWKYLSRFTTWRPYEHRVLANINSKLLPIPINLTTINTLYKLNLSSEGMQVFLAQRAEEPETIRTAKDVVLAAVGRDLYEKFFEGYTRKQWGVDPSKLDKSVTARIPTRTNTDDRYFGDTYQAMPKCGYTRLFENMLDHPNIKVMVNTDYREIVKSFRHDRLIYTGPVDEFFDYRFGRLPYRSLSFRHVTLDRPQFQPTAVVNYPSTDVPYTRITEYKYLTGQTHDQTSISYETPCDEGDPYYPVPNPENAVLYKKYETLAAKTPGVWFAGRLATYRYYNMDQVVAQSLALYSQLSELDGSLAQDERTKQSIVA
ncbi:UDP-galactopyranose mutase [Limnobacter parvus]|uniref:UDP-galactopyranose mutase n=1 Tax=Limnobacter parvus TaxID=2939690 RepID=UPI0027D46297|nr:UDP-galactopyranose mutase [Limnobacter parvus]